jgi:small subunit ribosomal protein S17
MEAKRVTDGKKLVGVVVKDKMDKTVVVEVERVYKHPKYHKYVKTRKTCKAHDAANEAKVGDKVIIVECRPLSREKRWLLKEVLRKEAIIPSPQEVES